MSNAEFKGICSNCRYAIECRHRQESTEVVFFCNEYELVDSNNSKSPENNLPTVENSPEDFSSEVKGLCCNCENISTCTFPKPEGGVWHCEEYI